MWVHLSVFAAALAVPLLPAFILWITRRRESALVDDHGRECMNVQIWNLFLGLAGMFLSVCGIGLVLIVFAIGLAIWSAIAGAIAASQGRLYRAPMTARPVTPARIPAGVIVRSTGVS